MNEKIIRINELCLSYSETKVIENLTVEIPCGSQVAIIGPNGSGKTTLLKSILGLKKMTSGQVMIGDDHAHHHSPRIGYVPQRRQLASQFPTTVRSVIEQGRFLKLGRWKKFTDDDRKLVDQAITELHLEDVQERQINQLSGGQTQRVLLARALAQGADIFLLDEPFEGLDKNSVQYLLEVFTRWKEQHRTFLVVLHQHNLLRDHFSHTLVLGTEETIFGRTTELLESGKINQVYESIPVIESKMKQA